MVSNVWDMITPLARISAFRIIAGIKKTYPVDSEMGAESADTSAGKVRFGSGSGPLALNAELERHIWFRPPLNPEPERRFRFGSRSNAFELE